MTRPAHWQTPLCGCYRHPSRYGTQDAQPLNIAGVFAAKSALWGFPDWPNKYLALCLKGRAFEGCHKAENWLAVFKNEHLTKVNLFSTSFACKQSDRCNFIRCFPRFIFFFR